MRRTLLITLLLSLSFPTYADWLLERDSFSTRFGHEWSDSDAIVVDVGRTQCGDWNVIVAAMQEGSDGNETLKVRINKRAIHDGDPDLFKDIKRGAVGVDWYLSDEEEASMRNGGVIYVKYDTRATVEIPLDVASKHMAEIDQACDKEKDVWQ